MPRFAANLTMMFNEVPFADRFDAAAAAGFTAVECLFPYALEPGAVAKRLQRNGLEIALFNMPPGDWDAGDRGFAALPARASELDAALATTLRYAEATGVRRVHLMAGIADRSDEAALRAYRDAVRRCADALGGHGLDLVLEPINGRDMPGYFLNDFEWTANFINAMSVSNVKLQFDLYHRQILHGDATMALRRMLPMIGHIQIASVPSRNEPDGEELNFPFLFEELDRLGYDGFVGCEYRPRAGTQDGLGWFAPYAGRRHAEEGTRS
ncbi:TIM barrel protein [Lichenicola cladoniae]|uniref:TIM barrel protein n=1 Tax=Lichenicola cladoniae TaxID=1484109 RepID=A0A6M8HGL9_9PROT|nr:2-oxo-tetronate isomerase [Lichenicola cladoniae]NPD69190.1 TIM barrel protein [Acetobacteraceae bacterium]QKE89017.1 TIM barrel protein [Lichenicola cladoniae]